MMRSKTYARGAGVDVAAEAAQFVQLDGDEFGEARHVSCTVHQGGLLVAVPRGHDISRRSAFAESLATA